MLREVRPKWLDWDNVAEELEGMARSDKHKLRSQLERLLLHLLKFRYAESHRGEFSWRKSVFLARKEIADLLEESPSLRGQLENLLVKAYPHARRYAGGFEMRLADDVWKQLLPEKCPWTLEQILTEDFLPRG